MDRALAAPRGPLIRSLEVRRVPRCVDVKGSWSAVVLSRCRYRGVRWGVEARVRCGFGDAAGDQIIVDVREVGDLCECA